MNLEQSQKTAYMPCSNKFNQPLRYQNQPTSQILLNLMTYQLNQYDDEYFKYLKDKYVKGQQNPISKNTDWLKKDPRGFRYKISNLISQIAKKNSNTNLQSHEKDDKLQKITNQFQRNKISSNDIQNKNIQIQHLEQQLNSQKMYAKNNLQEITKLKSQFKQMKETNENLLIQNNKLKKSLHQTQYKINGLHNLCNLKDTQIIDLKELNSKILEDFKKINQQVQRYKKISEEKSQRQTQLITQLSQINTELKRRLNQNEDLINQIFILNVKISEKNNWALLKQSQIKALKKKQKQLNSKIAKCEEIIGEKDQKIAKITNQLKEKQILIKDLENKNLQKNAKTTIEVIPEEKIKQPQKQKRKSVPQRKANFRSFITRQDSNTKNTLSTNKIVQKSLSKSSQINAIQDLLGQTN